MVLTVVHDPRSRTPQVIVDGVDLTDVCVDLQIDYRTDGPQATVTLVFTEIELKETFDGVGQVRKRR